MSSPVSTTDEQSAEHQQSFASNDDLDKPEQAVSSYSKLIHQHTLRQMELAATSSNHRTNGNNSISSLQSEESVDSVDTANSVDSVQQ